MISFYLLLSVQQSNHFLNAMSLKLINNFHHSYFFPFSHKFNMFFSSSAILFFIFNIFMISLLYAVFS